MLRRPTAELLDADSGTPREVADSLRDLRWFNRWFGGLATMRAIFDKIIERTGSNRLSVLEVASGEGYVPGQLHEEFAKRGVALSFALLDRVTSHLPAKGSFPKIAGDALHLPFSGGSFDVVACSLFVHHLSPEGASTFIREALRVSRTAVLVHDLVRHPLHLALAYAGLPLYRSRITRYDAPASVGQAYNVAEMKGIFRAAGAENIQVIEHYLFRMGVIGWKEAPSR